MMSFPVDVMNEKEKKSDMAVSKKDVPCHTEITVLSADLEFCPICGFYYSKNTN